MFRNLQKGIIGDMWSYMAGFGASEEGWNWMLLERQKLYFW